MKPYEFKRFYHPKMGKFVYKHKGNGFIVDNIFKLIRSIASSVLKNAVKPFAKKAIKSGVEHAGERSGKKAAEKSGDLIMKQLRGRKQTKLPTIKEESTDMLLNRMILGEGVIKKK